MANRGNEKKPAPEDLRTQLTELNNRARAYASQLWQVPFAYIAFAAILLTQSEGARFRVGLLLICVVGIAVLIHMFFGVHFHNGTVLRIQVVEKAMGLDVATHAKPGGTVAPFMTVVFLGVVAPAVVLFRSSPLCVILLVCALLAFFAIVAYCVCNRLSSGNLTTDGNAQIKTPRGRGET
jgi:hypothetical protein